MTTASLTVAALVALASGQGAGDRQAYGIHQERLAAPVGPVSTGIPTADAPAGPSGSAPAGTGCLLVPGGSNLATPSDCLACHASHDARHSHPVDVHRDSPRSRSLRSSAEVVTRPGSTRSPCPPAPRSDPASRLQPPAPAGCVGLDPE